MFIIDKRQRIIQAAIEVFSDKGIEKSTVSEIVTKAGIAQGTFYLYFPSKLAVMPAIAEVLVNKMLDRLKSEVENVPIHQQMEQIINVIFNITRDYKNLTKLLYSGLTQTQFVGDWERIYTPLYTWMEGLLVRAQEAESINPEINTKYTAKFIIGSIESAAEQVYLYDNQDIQHINEHRNELNKFLVYALGIYR